MCVSALVSTSPIFLCASLIICVLGYQSLINSIHLPVTHFHQTLKAGYSLHHQEKKGHAIVAIFTSGALNGMGGSISLKSLENVILGAPGWLSH